MVTHLLFKVFGLIWVKRIILVLTFLCLLTEAGLPVMNGLCEDNPATIEMASGASETRLGDHPGFQYGTILGSVSYDNVYVHEIAVDQAGNVLVAGRTNSDQFPTTAGAFDKTLSGSSDLFLTKFDPTLSTMIFSTLIGGTGTEWVNEIAPSANGGVYMVGSTKSPDFPVTGGAFCTTFGGEDDAFFLEVNAQGTDLEYSTLFGGSGDESASGITFDSKGRPVVVGETESTDFPLTVGAFDTSLGGTRDAFALKFNEDLTDLEFSTLLGGPGLDGALGVVMQPDDSFIIAGPTEGGIPTTSGAYASTFLNDGHYVCRMNASGDGLAFSTYVPDGSGDDDLEAFDADSQGNVYLVGRSKSDDLPTTPGALHTDLNATQNGILIVLSNWGQDLAYCTYINSGDNNDLYDVALNGNETLISVGGSVKGDDLAVTINAFDTTWRGGAEDKYDGLLCVFNLSSMDLNYATYFGGSSQEIAMCIAWDDDVVHIGARTNSEDAYVSDGAYQEVHPGADQGYIVKIDPRPGRLPRTPSNIWATPTTSDVTLTWGRPGDEGGCRIEEYRIEKLNVSGSWDLLNASYTFRHSDEDVENGEAYRFRVSAVSGAGQGAYATVTVEIPPVVPMPPQSLIASTGNGTVTLNWSAPTWTGGARIEGYEILRGPTTLEMTRLARIGHDLHYVDIDVVLGEFNFYEVAARNSVGVGPSSNKVRIKALDIPSPPRDFRAEAGDGSVKLSWSLPKEDGGTMLIGYYLYRGTTIDNISLLATKTVVHLEHMDASVTNGKAYIYYLTAFSNVGESGPSPALDATPFGVPGRVTDLVATAGDGEVVLNWSAPEDDGGRQISMYNVLSGETMGSMTLLTTIGNITTFIHSDLTNGVTYHYAVFAVNGGGEGSVSETVSASPMALSGPPTDLAVVSEKVGVRVTWGPPGDSGGAEAVTFKVIRSTTPDGADPEVYSANGALEFLDVNVTVGETYNYWVQSFTAFGASASAGPVEVVVSTVPGTVRDLTTTIGDGEVHLTWSAPDNDGGMPVVEYVVKRGIFVTGLVEIARVSTLSYTDSDLDNGKEYLYVVIAINGIGQGPQSNVVEGKPLGPPGAPGLFSAKVEGKKVVLSWVDITGYVVLRATGDGEYEVLAQVDETTYTDEDVKTGVRYRYTVKAQSDIGDGESTISADAKVKKEEESPGFTGLVMVVAMVTILLIRMRGRDPRDD